MSILSMIMKYGPIIILYLFIFRLIYFIIKDVRESKAVQFVENRDFFLSVVESNDPEIPKGKRIPLKSLITIGRGEKNDIVITDAFTSHKHAQIESSSEGYILQDLGSLNGVFINNQRINKPTILGPKSKIKIGGVTFQFMRWENEVQ